MLLGRELKCTSQKVARSSAWFRYVNLHLVTTVPTLLSDKQFIMVTEQFSVFCYERRCSMTSQDRHWFPIFWTMDDLVSRCSAYKITKLPISCNRMTWSLWKSDIISTSAIGITMDGFAKPRLENCFCIVSDHVTTYKHPARYHWTLLLPSS